MMGTELVNPPNIIDFVYIIKFRYIGGEAICRLNCWKQPFKFSIRHSSGRTIPSLQCILNQPQEDVHHKNYEYTSLLVSFPGLPNILFLTAYSLTVCNNGDKKIWE